MSNQLPIKIENGGKKTEGFCTPKEDKAPQKVSVLPKRVLPIVFLPGIMGSNLRLLGERQSELQKKNNVAWRPDSLRESVSFLSADSARRQSQLDPMQTEVDIFDPVTNPTGTVHESAELRHDLGLIRTELHVGVDTPLLMDDPFTQKGRKTKERKAKERGWGEVYFGSYRTLLEMCEQQLNTTFWEWGVLESWWKNIVDVPPSTWQAHVEPMMATISREQLKDAVKGCWFPVHAMGYNWLRSNREAGMVTATRIQQLIASYQAKGYQCEKVVIVTHSMGGLVARALIHPEMGNLEGKILGIVHGVMPATGAAATYKRMRCGFEEGFFGLAPAPKVLGNLGPEVTAVLANSPGGLELLPSQAYGNGWLKFQQGKNVLRSLPEKGDPYEEIYKVRDKWYGLVREEWLNPADDDKCTFARTCKYLDRAREFHSKIETSYHPVSYAHYGSDSKRPSWEQITWHVDEKIPTKEWANLSILKDNEQGKLDLRGSCNENVPYKVFLGASVGAGDETVPLRSAEHQLRSGKFRGIFRQSGYEHQGSYSNRAALHSTIFSLIRIIETMKWSVK